MRFSRLALCALTVVTSADAAPTASNSSLNSTFYMKTVLKPSSAKKTRFADLYLSAYHTGAGFNDIVFYPNISFAAPAHFNTSTDLGYGDNGELAYPIQFDIEGSASWTFEVDTTANEYSSWEPTRINAAYDPPVGAFYNTVNTTDTGMMWTSSPGAERGDEFGGWLVCEWWHAVPQLFSRWTYDDQAVPCSCADVWLYPVYE